MATKQPRKQAKSAEKSDIGGANQPARGHQRTPRRRTSQARSKSMATQTGEAAARAAAASRGTSKSIGRSKNTTPPPGDPASQPDRIAEGVNLAMAKMPDADRLRGSTKRAMLVNLLERPEGASVAEIGQRLGWLPHTVRAAFTGLRHAGREVTRNKDATGQSVYRLARSCRSCSRPVTANRRSFEPPVPRMKVSMRPIFISGLYGCPGRHSTA
jgi:hypothetical protein